MAQRRQRSFGSLQSVIITHGWPGSMFEELKIIDPLTEPTAHGGREPLMKRLGDTRYVAD